VRSVGSTIVTEAFGTHHCTRAPQHRCTHTHTERACTSLSCERERGEKGVRDRGREGEKESCAKGHEALVSRSDCACVSRRKDTRRHHGKPRARCRVVVRWPGGWGGGRCRGWAGRRGGGGARNDGRGAAGREKHANGPAAARRYGGFTSASFFTPRFTPRFILALLPTFTLLLSFTPCFTPSLLLVLLLLYSSRYSALSQIYSSLYLTLLLALLNFTPRFTELDSSLYLRFQLPRPHPLRPHTIRSLLVCGCFPLRLSRI